MQKEIVLWIREIRRYNQTLNLVGQGMLARLEDEVHACMILLERIHEPALADLGSGAGLPGIPYAVLHPDSQVFLIERGQKKCLFLKHVVDLLGLEHVRVLDADPLRDTMGPFAAVIARAFSPKAALSDAVSRLLSIPGRFYYLGTFPPQLARVFIERGHTAQEGKGLKLFTYGFVPA